MSLWRRRWEIVWPRNVRNRGKPYFGSKLGSTLESRQRTSARLLILNKSSHWMNHWVDLLANCWDDGIVSVWLCLWKLAEHALTRDDSHLRITRRDGRINDGYGHEKYTEKKWKEVDNTDPYNVDTLWTWEVHQNRRMFWFTWLKLAWRQGLRTNGKRWRSAWRFYGHLKRWFALGSLDKGEICEFG